jgi:hypothetical protein
LALRPGRPWIPLFALGCAAAACRFGYDEQLVILGAGASGGASGLGGSLPGGTSAGGDAGDLGEAGDAQAIGGKGGSSMTGAGGSLSAGSDGSGGNGASGGAGGISGSSPTGGQGGNGGTGGSATSGGAGASSAGAGAAAGAGGGGTPPDSELCVQASYGGHDYLLCPELRTWFDANAGCAAIGMRLVRVDDADENQWLFDNAVVPMGRDSRVWLGGWDVPVDGEWRWTDGDLFWLGDELGSAQNGLFAGWSSREPNDVDGDEDCATLDTSSSRPDWIDIRCDDIKAYVCESP